MNIPAPQILSKQEDQGTVLSFGELLLRLCPDTEGAWLHQNKVPFYVGGAEANVAAALALWGIPVSYLSRVPDHEIGRQVVQYLAAKGIDVSRMLYGGDRLGLYFLQQGKDLKHAAVIYDRAHSAFSQLKPEMVDWDKILQGVSWLHLSAISPAINATVADLCKAAASAAAQKGIVVSLDLNYRAKLWQYGKTPLEVMPEIVRFCKVVMGNIWAVEKMLGYPLDVEQLQSDTREAYLEQALQVSETIMRYFPNVNVVANTFRFQQPPRSVQYYATVYAAGQFHTSAQYKLRNVVDSVGSGDSFMAGLIYGFYKKFPLQQTLDFAASAAIQKLSEPGDAISSSADTIQQLIQVYER